jgi:TM2 domain-containing membrane protein YozV
MRGRDTHPNKLIDIGVSRQTYSGVQMSDSTIFCTGCGEVMPADAQFCAKCGKRNATLATEPESAQPASGAPHSPTVIPAPTERDYTPGAKSRITAGILGILLGGIGVHKFYLNKVGLGILYVVFCWTAIPAIIGLVEGIIYLTQDDVTFGRQQMVAVRTSTY